MDFHELHSLSDSLLAGQVALMGSTASAYLYTVALDPQPDALAFQQARIVLATWLELVLLQKELNSTFLSTLSENL